MKSSFQNKNQRPLVLIATPSEYEKFYTYKKA